MYKKKKTYELEVHFGLLVLVIIMLCLNIVSNYVIYNTRNIQLEEISADMYISTLAISRYMQNNQLTSISKSEKQNFLFKYKLDDILIISSSQEKLNKSEKLIWLNQILKDIPQDQILNISKIIIKSNFHTLTRGENDNYFYVTPFQLGKKQNLLIVSQKNKKLAYLDDASNILVTISLVTVFAIAIIYMLLYRFILSPFRNLKEKAALAGRTIPSGDYEVNSVIDEYELIIKELKEKEAELVELHKEATHRADSFEKFNQYLLGSMKAGIITIDKTGEILTINKSVENMCQIQADNFNGKTYLSLPFLNETLKNKIKKTLVSNKHHPYEEYKFKSPSLDVGLIISPVCDNETHQFGASILINDISEIKKLQNELEKNRQMSALGEMSAGLAHQLRNSLGAIVGYNQLVKKRLSQHNLETTIVDSMATELKESEHLIRRFLNFTKPFDYSPENEMIADFVEDIINTLSIRSDFRQITFHYDNKLSENCSILIDQLLLKQAMTNIIENSKNAYSNQKGVIDICLSEENRRCIITIQDYACGIDNENLSKIFTPFYSTNPSGTGLGLPLAQKVIVLHDGNLLVESTDGIGTIFKILLPLNHQIHKQTTEKILQ